MASQCYNNGYTTSWHYITDNGTF